MELLSPVDFKNIPNLSFAWELRTTSPTASAGRSYFDTSTSKFMGYDGTSWLDLGNPGLTTISVANANGFFGSTAYSTNTATITLICSVSGVLKSNGTAISAATSADIPTPLTTKGDLFTWSTAGTRLGVGANKTVLTANSAQTTGLQWVSLDSTYISNFDTQVRTSRLDQMAAPTASVSANSQKITNLANGTATTDAANYGQITSAINQFPWKAAVRCCGPGTLATAFAAGQVLDGQTLVTGDRIFVLNGTSTDNGIYTVNASGAPTRAVDADQTGEILLGTRIPITSGNVYANSILNCTALGSTPWVPGTSTSTWDTSVYTGGSFRTRVGNSGGGDLYTRHVQIGPAGFVYFNDPSGSPYGYIGGDGIPPTNFVVQSNLGGSTLLQIDMTTGAASIPSSSSILDSLNLGSAGSANFGLRSYLVKGFTQAQLLADNFTFVQCLNGTTSLLGSSVNLGATTSNVILQGTLTVTNITTPATLTVASTNDWAPASPIGNIVRVSANSGISITGIVAASQRRFTLCNIGSNAISILHDSSSSATTNRIYCPGNVTFTLRVNACVDMWYDPNSSRWRLIAV